MGTDLVFDALVFATKDGGTKTHDGPDGRCDHAAGRWPEEAYGRCLDPCAGDQTLVSYERDGSVDDGWVAGVDGVGTRVCCGVYLWIYGFGLGDAKMRCTIIKCICTLWFAFYRL